MNFIRTRLHQQSYEIGHSSVGHAQRRRMVSDFWSITCNERIEIISVCRHTGGRLTICAIKCWQCPKKKIDNGALKEHVRLKQITFQIKKLNTNTNTDTNTNKNTNTNIYTRRPPLIPPPFLMDTFCQIWQFSLSTTEASALNTKPNLYKYKSNKRYECVFLFPSE